MTVAELVSLLQVLAFAVLAMLALRTWLTRRRDRPASYLLATFGVMFLVVAAGAVTPETPGTVGELVARVLPALLATFPWFFVAFAWSFDGPLPRWQFGALAIVVALGVWTVVVPPGELEEGSTALAALLVTFVATWTVLTVLAAVKLWRVRGRAASVQSRTRLMAVGALALNAALVAAAFVPAGDATQIATTVLTILSAALFLAGFAPPPLLRRWWRGRTGPAYQRMLSALIAARTVPEVGAAIVPMVAEVVGAGVAVVDLDGRIVDSSRLDDLAADHASHAVRTGVDDPDVEVYPAGPVALVVARTSYTPVFSAEERGLAASLAIQLQLAMQRIGAYEQEAEARVLAERAQRELEATMYGLAHDLRAPTVAITGFAQLLDETADPQERDEMAAHIRAAAEYVDGLVDALLEVSRVGRTQTMTQPVDLAALASRVGERLRTVHPQLRVEVDGLPTLRLNPVRAEQLLENLLGNAGKHAGRPDVTVSLTSRREDGEVVLVVADDGQGIPEADREQVFDLYHRGSHGHPGSGIGLGLVRRIAESYGGSVGLEDEGPGATFLVRLPESVVEPSSA